MSDPKRVLFVCVENAGRSQMAEAFMRRHAPHMRAASAGTMPGRAVNPAVADAMAEVGIDVGGNVPRRLDPGMARGAVVVGMGCADGDTCPAVQARAYLDWKIPDPKGKTLGEVRKIRDQIESRVRELIRELG